MVNSIPFATINITFIADRIFMVDRLAALFEHFHVKAHTFQTGHICGSNFVNQQRGYGQLHIIRTGNVVVWHGKKKAYTVTQPSLLFYPRPLDRQFIVQNEQQALLLCAHVAFVGDEANPIASALPESLCLPLSSLTHCEKILNLLFEESESAYCGRQVVLDRLFEVLLVQLLRELMESGKTQIGMLAGLADLHLRKALVAIHEQPQEDWTVERLAAKSGMSRSVFSNLFRETLGTTPMKYLQNWRIGLVQKWLKSGQSLKLIAEEAGYQSESALSRAFKAQVGLSPREWLASNR